MSKPGTENTIRYTNLAPGKYTLRVRAISNEDKRIMLEERSMDIIIAQPFWLTFWAMRFIQLSFVSLPSSYCVY